MNDRFKFRVWNKENKKLYDWDFLEKTKGENTFFWVMHQAQNDCKHNILMQCTGLKDKNGKLIYEGDYIKNLKTNTIYKVFWEDKATCFMLKSTRFGGVVSTYMMFEEYPNDLEVIGNIYENEDLLKCENQ